MFKKIFFSLCLLAAGLAAEAQETQTTSSTFPKPAQADRSTMAPHIGILAGMTSPEGSFDSTGSVALDFGFQPYIPFGLGAEVAYFKASGQDGNEDIESTQILAKGTYNFGGDVAVIKDSYVGLAAGAQLEDDDTDLVAAPMLGFDIPLSHTTPDYVSLGANARYAFVEGSSPDAFTLSGAVKYWY